MLPSLYISHGSPMLMLMNNETTKFLENLPSTFKEPKYILVISAHWVTQDLKILYEESPNLIYDFYGFPKELYDLTINVSSSKQRNDEIIQLFEKNGIKLEKDITRGGFDHGVWSPLRFMYPNKEIPILQISLPYGFTQNDLFKVGEILSSLREDTLIIGSGALTHNLRDIIWDEDTPQVKEYARVFHDWITENLKSGNYEEILNSNEKAPYLKQNHPTLDHFMPLFVNLGSSKSKVGKSLNNIYMYGNQSMDTYIFEE